MSINHWPIRYQVVRSFLSEKKRFNEPSSTSHPVSQRLIGVVTFSDLIYARETLSLDAGFLLLSPTVFQHALLDRDRLFSTEEGKSRVSGQELTQRSIFNRAIVSAIFPPSWWIFNTNQDILNLRKRECNEIKFIYYKNVLL